MVLYWYETATFDTNSTTQTKSVMISLIMYPSSPQNVSDTENQELPFASAINNYWQPIRAWTAVALGISQNGLTLSAGATVFLVLLTLYAVFLDRKEKLALLNLYRKLPAETQLLMKAVTNAQNNHNPTVQGITLELQKLSQTFPSDSWITQKLVEAEKTGLIKKMLINKDDNPAFALKNQMPQKTNLFNWLKNLKL